MLSVVYNGTVSSTGYKYMSIIWNYNYYKSGAWFLEILSATSVCVCVCVCVLACLPRGYKLHSRDTELVKLAEQVC